ncbi:alpha/beta hydrolase [Corallococcus sp. AB011P]|uniref:alpha/beta fold hydrolase n=1 Tax=Corallococcus sp. AB011P TaxID=2316735 RepID=UPI000EA30440|nr:alpha/beta hydrolase [Corallococcus sp. AB011P]RKG62751.1 alpha/beta hydrolase [Corallococcus sp. AB011P]
MTSETQTDSPHLERISGTFLTTKDGTQLYFKDWGPKDGQPVVFSHGWALTSDAFEDQMLFLSEHGYRTIAHDRRGHGRSSQPWDGHDMDTYADDLSELTSALALRKAVHVGHSLGGGEVARYIGRHGTSRVAKVVLIGAVLPILIKTDWHPNGLPMQVFDDLRAGVRGDRSSFFKELSLAFYGFNRPGARVSEGLLESYRLQGVMGSLKAEYDCIKAFSETDFRADLARFDVPTLVMHGDDDQLVPIDGSARITATLVKGAKLQVFPGFSHGMCSVNKDVVNEALLAFLEE